MLVYDVTNERTFENIRNWIRNIEEVSLCVNLAQHLGSLTLRAYNFSLECLISKLKHAFNSSLVGLSNNVFRSLSSIGSKCAHFLKKNVGYTIDG